MPSTVINAPLVLTDIQLVDSIAKALCENTRLGYISAMIDLGDKEGSDKLFSEIDEFVEQEYHGYVYQAKRVLGLI